jgi:hypothetical protein
MYYMDPCHFYQLVSINHNNKASDEEIKSKATYISLVFSLKQS